MIFYRSTELQINKTSKSSLVYIEGSGRQATPFFILTSSLPRSCQVAMVSWCLHLKDYSTNLKLETYLCIRTITGLSSIFPRYFQDALDMHSLRSQLHQSGWHESHWGYTLMEAKWSNLSDISETFNDILTYLTETFNDISDNVDPVGQKCEAELWPIFPFTSIKRIGIVFVINVNKAFHHCEMRTVFNSSINIIYWINK